MKETGNVSMMTMRSSMTKIRQSPIDHRVHCNILVVHGQMGSCRVFVSWTKGLRTYLPHDHSILHTRFSTVTLLLKVANNLPPYIWSPRRTPIIYALHLSRQTNERPDERRSGVMKYSKTCSHADGFPDVQ